MATTRTGGKVASKPTGGKDTPPKRTEAEDKAKAQAEAEPTVEEKREERAEIIEELRDADAEKTKAVQAEAKAAGLHEAKLDDEGAAAQQAAARDTRTDLLDRLGILEADPAVTAPVIEEAKGASISIYSRLDSELKTGSSGDAFGAKVDKARFVGNKLWVVGKGFPFPGEIIIDVRRENGQDHQRFSLWAEADVWEVNLPGLGGPGDWLVHAEHVVTRVGEGRDDHIQRIIESKPVQLEIY